jgi:DNA-binding NarL/FixJ family response regulator
MVTGAMRKHSSRLEAGSAPVRKIRVVLVDDSPLVRASLGRLLRGFLPLQIAGQAENGLHGFTLAAQLQPDLVITDLHMPGLAGFQLVELLRYNYPAMRSIITSPQEPSFAGFQLVELLRQNYPAMKSIIISAHDGPTLRAASLQHGADAFITKQRLPEELPALLARLFPNATGPAIEKCKH